MNQEIGFRDNMIQLKESLTVAHQLAAAATRQACDNQMVLLLQMKDQALLSERLAAQASKEAAECCCEIKELIRSDGQKTQDLINTREINRLRDAVIHAEQKLVILGKVS